MSFTFFFFPLLLPTPLGGGRGKWLRGAELLAGVKPRHEQRSAKTYVQTPRCAPNKEMFCHPLDFRISPAATYGRFPPSSGPQSSRPSNRRLLPNLWHLQLETH